MNRRELVQGLVVCGIAAPYTGIALTAGTGVVTILKHTPDTHYEKLSEFATEKEAVAFVQALIPQIHYIEIVRDTGNEANLQSGYRGALRAQYRDGDIRHIIYEIIDERSGHVVVPPDFDGCLMWECARAWAIIENIRVNGKPVSAKRVGSSLPVVFTQPFKTGSYETIHYVDKDGNPVEA